MLGVAASEESGGLLEGSAVAGHHTGQWLEESWGGGHLDPEIIRGLPDHPLPVQGLLRKQVLGALCVQRGQDHRHMGDWVDKMPPRSHGTTRLGGHH